MVDAIVEDCNNAVISPGDKQGPPPLPLLHPLVRAPTIVTQLLPLAAAGITHE